MKLRPQKPKQFWPASRIEQWSVTRLKASPFNARLHTDADVDAIAASMTRFGVTNPVLVDEDGSIIAGHCRVMAAVKLNYPRLPVMVARGWSEEEKRAYCIADNQLAARATWDDAGLVRELEYLRNASFDIGLLGFEPDVLNKMLCALPGSSLVDPDAVPEPSKDLVTRPGDTWRLGGHRVHCGDCTAASAVAAALGDLKPVLMVTDPPYGVSYDASWRTGLRPNNGNHATGKVLNDDRCDWREAWSHFGGSVAYVWHGGLYSGVVGEGLAACGFALRAQIVWAKPHFVLSRGDYHWQHETCFYAVRVGEKSRWAGDRRQSTVWEIANNSAVNTERELSWGHSTQKPVECMRRPIENNSKPADTVYDPFLGSGTTLIAAEMTGRVCAGLELSPAYVDVIVRRWEMFVGQSARLESTGETFAEVEAVRQARTAASPPKAENAKTVPGNRQRVRSGREVGDVATTA